METCAITATNPGATAEAEVVVREEPTGEEEEREAGEVDLGEISNVVSLFKY